MKKAILLVGLGILLFGCTVPSAGYKIEYKILCDEFRATGKVVGEGIMESASITDCINSCGSKDNYRGWDCSGKYFACYCEKDPNAPVIVQNEPEPVTPTPPDANNQVFNNVTQVT